MQGQAQGSATFGLMLNRLLQLLNRKSSASAKKNDRRCSDLNKFRSDLLQVRKESWQEGLRQDSITYMEMYNRRNPKKKRTYPSFDSSSPS